MKAALLLYLKQASTWRGLALLAGVFGVAIDPAALEVVGAGVVAALGVVEVVRNEVANKAR